MKVILVLHLVVFTHVALVSAAPGDLDSTFGVGGKAIITIAASKSVALAVASQGEKTIVAGYIFNGDVNDMVVARLDSSGSLDATFGSSGSTIVQIPAGNSAPTSLAIQSDGKIVVVGSVNVGTNRKFALVRLDLNGALDPSFGTGGIVTTSLGISQDVANSVVIQPDGKILVGGWSRQASSPDFAIVRYQSNGSLDSSFGTGGFVLTNFNGTSQDTGECIALSPDGKIILGGTYNDHVTGSFLAVAKYLPNGALDVTFGSGGKVTTFVASTPGNTNGSVETLAIQNDGKIVVGGHFSNGTKGSFLLGRYLPSGVLDANFGIEGIVISNLTSGHDYGECVLVQPDGKILFAGYSLPISRASDFLLARYNANGILDPTFGSGGRVVTDFGADDEASSMVLQSDGRVVLAGLTRSGPTHNFALARYGGGNTALTNFEAWRFQWFGTIEGVGNAANLFDPEGDGVVNMLEFASFSNPTISSPSTHQAVLNGPNVDFTYTRSKGAMADGFSFVVEWSDTLNPLDWSSTGVSETVTSENANIQTIKATMSAGNFGRRFIRLKIIAP
jgi:uncharacterized delta-60 repeat protein